MTYMSANFTWPNKAISGRMGINKFLQLFSIFLDKYYTTSDRILYHQRIILSATEILPDTCDNFLETIQEFRRSIRNISQFLENSGHLPETIVSGRYSMLFHLYRANELSNELIPLVHSFRMICLENDSETSRLHQQIVKKIGMLAETIETIQPESDILTKQRLF